MLKLMRLELMKTKMGWYTKGILIANLCIISLIVMIFKVEKMEGNSVVSGFDELFIVQGSMVRATFVVFAAVLISKLIIDEYKNKTIFVMFMYPINRKKIIASKLMLIAGMTFVSMLLSNIFVAAVFLVINHYVQFIAGDPSVDQYVQQLISILAFSIAAAGTSLIPLYFGMRKYSVPATITSSFLIVAVISSHNPIFSLASIIYIPIVLACFGIVLAWWSIRNIEKVDVA